MVAKEFKNNFDPVTQEGCEDAYEAEETLSLCDLAVNSNDTEDYSWSCTELSKEEQSSYNQDFFEFFSEDFSTDSLSSTYPEDNIIFCGKLIPYKEHAVPEQTQITNSQQKLEKGRVFPWKLSHSFNKARTRTTSYKAQQQAKSTCKPAVAQRHKYGKYRSYELSTLASAPVKSRWYLFAFGYGSFPTEMELRDIKNRQSRRIPAATMFRLDGGSSGGGGEMIKKSERRPSLWRLLRVLGCKSQQANAVIKASFGCIPQVCETKDA